MKSARHKALSLPAPPIWRLAALAMVAILLSTACGPRHVTRYADRSDHANTDDCRADTIGRLVPLSVEAQAILDDVDRPRDALTIELMLERAGREVAARSDSAVACVRTIHQGGALFAQLLRQNQARLATSGDFEPSDDARVLAVQRQITDWWREDQSARATLVALPLTETRSARFWANRLASAHVLRTDARATAYLEHVLEPYDWIDQRRFGHSVSAHAWILVQHADQRVDLQAEVLSRMRPFFEEGAIRPANYAYLWDRVAVNTGQPQRYGTQPVWTCVDGALELAPIEDRARADTLRQELGMNSVAEQLADMSRTVCGPPEH